MKMKRFSGILGLVLLGLTCNKNKDATANKAYVAVTNLARGSNSVVVTFDGQTIDTGGIPHDSSTGINTNRYATAVAGIHELLVKNVSGDSIFSQGNFSFLQNAYYFLYVYDTLTNGQYKIIGVQDPHTLKADPNTDTFSYFRFMNFCPDTAVTFFFVQNLYHDKRDSFYTSTFYPYVGNFPNPNRYSMITAHYGLYDGYIYIDTVQAHRIYIGKVTLPAGHAVSLLLNGRLNGTGADSLRLKTVYMY